MLSAYQYDQAQRNLSGYAVLGIPASLGVRTMSGGDCGCGCGGACESRYNPTLRGAPLPMTAAEAMQQAVKLYSGANLNPADFSNPSWITKAQDQIANGQFDLSVWNTVCGGTPPSLNLFSTVSGLSLGAAGAGTAIASSIPNLISAGTSMALGAVTMGAGLLISVISMIFAHHAAAVKRDLQFGCSALPAVNNAFSVIAQAVQNGQTTPAAAIAGLDKVYSQFMSAGGASGPSGIPGSGTAINDHPFCNANCEMSVILKGMVIYWQAQYAGLAASSSSSQVQPTPAPPVTASTPGQPGSGSAGSGPVNAPTINSGSTMVLPAVAAASPASSPNWLMIAAFVAVGLAISRFN